MIRFDKLYKIWSFSDIYLIICNFVLCLRLSLQVITLTNFLMSSLRFEMYGSFYKSPWMEIFLTENSLNAIASVDTIFFFFRLSRNSLSLTHERSYQLSQWIWKIYNFLRWRLFFINCNFNRCPKFRLTASKKNNKVVERASSIQNSLRMFNWIDIWYWKGN